MAWGLQFAAVTDPLPVRSLLSPGARKTGQTMMSVVWLVYEGRAAMSSLSPGLGVATDAFSAPLRGAHAEWRTAAAMGFLNRIFGRRREAPREEAPPVNLAFVLLAEPRLCPAADIQRAFGAFAAPGEQLQMDSESADAAGEAQVHMFRLSTGETGFVALMPAPVPNGEADNGAQFSLSSFRDGWKLPPHQAHLIVSFTGTSADPALVRIQRFTSCLAAVTKAAPAVGVYWGNAGATHDAEFFVSIASDPGIVPRIMLWSGVSVARESDGRLSLLSLGMQQLALPDLLLIASPSSVSGAIETMFDLLAYAAQRGEAPPDGDTVGRTADERLPVRYVPSPIDPKKKVWHVVLE